MVSGDGDGLEGTDDDEPRAHTILSEERRLAPAEGGPTLHLRTQRMVPVAGGDGSGKGGHRQRRSRRRARCTGGGRGKAPSAKEKRCWQRASMRHIGWRLVERRRRWWKIWWWTTGEEEPMVGRSATPVSRLRPRHARRRPPGHHSQRLTIERERKGEGKRGKRGVREYDRWVPPFFK